jgi:hypothetical protein
MGSKMSKPESILKHSRMLSLIKNRIIVKYSLAGRARHQARRFGRPSSLIRLEITCVHSLCRGIPAARYTDPETQTGHRRQRPKYCPLLGRSVRREKNLGIGQQERFGITNVRVSTLGGCPVENHVQVALLHCADNLCGGGHLLTGVVGDL